MPSYQDIKFKGWTYLRVLRNAKISIGRGFTCNSGPYYSVDTDSNSRIVVRDNAFLFIGENSGMSNASIYCANRIVIGKNVNIGAGCMIFDTNFHSIYWKNRENVKDDQVNVKTLPISIGDNVFIGARSIIMKGVTIGARSVIAAGSVVISTVPSDEMWGGNPARYIKSL